MDFNAGSSVGRRWAKPLAASGQLHGRHWAGSHGRRQPETSSAKLTVQTVSFAALVKPQFEPVPAYSRVQVPVTALAETSEQPKQPDEGRCNVN